MIKTVKDLRAKFSKNIKFYFYKNGIYQQNAMSDDKIIDWCVNENFEVIVNLK